MLDLVKFSKEDYALYAGLVFNEQTMKMNLGRVFTPEEATIFFQMITACNDAGGETGFYKVLLPDAEKVEFIGMGAINWNDEYDAYEIEYMLLPDYWHRGYGTALVERLLKRADEARQKADVIAIADPANVYSQRILRRFGFELVQQFTNDDGDPAVLYRKAN